MDERRKRRMTKTIIAAILGLCLVFSAAATASSQNPGSVAPQFTLKDINGKEVSLSSFKGKVIILDFWATWCPPCREEIPDFIALQKEYGTKGLQVIGISVDKDKDALVKFYKDNGMNYPVVLTDGAVEAKYGGIRGIPTTFIIDRTGKIAKKYVGAISKKQFESDIKPLLGK